MSYNKFKAIRTVVEGIQFDSRGESVRYLELRNLERAGIIKNLERQPEFEIAINGKLIFKYRADYAYDEDGVRVIEDFKSEATKTPVYRIKKKAVEAAYGIKIRETGIRPKRDARSERISQEVREIFSEAGRKRA
jgi:hypothetical protein